MITMKYIGERSRMNYVYTRNEKLIKSKTKEFLGIGSVVTASTYLDYVIDFVLVGGLLGANALAAAELCDSFVDIAEPPGFVISSGGSIAAGILLGKRKHAQANPCVYAFLSAGSVGRPPLLLFSAVLRYFWQAVDKQWDDCEGCGAVYLSDNRRRTLHWYQFDYLQLCHFG